MGNRFSVVHPIPTFDNLTALSLVLDRMEQLGLWLVSCASLPGRVRG
jgi:hypothetical protein